MEIDSYLSEKQKKKKRRQRYVFVVVAAAIIVILFVGTTWLILYSPFFRVQNVVIKGNSAVASDSIVTLLQSNASSDRGFLISLLGLKNMLIWPPALNDQELAFIPQLASVTLSKNYFTHTIIASVVERKPFGIWCFVLDKALSAPSAPAAAPSSSAFAPPAIESGETCYWFDDQGILFGKTYDTQGSSLFAIHDYSQAGRGLGNKILPDEFVPNFMSIVKVLTASGANVREVALKDIGLQEVGVTTYDGPDLYFSLRFPADNDLAVLQSLMAKPNFAKLQYVDFRVENRAYYK